MAILNLPHHYLHVHVHCKHMYLSMGPYMYMYMYTYMYVILQVVKLFSIVVILLGATFPPELVWNNTGGSNGGSVCHVS